MYVDEFTTMEILRDVLKIEIAKQDRAAQTRLACVMKRLGFESRSFRRDGRVTRRWVRENLSTGEETTSL